MKLVFFSSMVFIIYTYVGYPMMLLFLASIVQFKRDIQYNLARKDRRKSRDAIRLPMVSLVVAAYNEEKIIEEKIRNCLGQDYPKSHLEVVIASDASTDGTNAIVKGYQEQGIKLLSFDERCGKTSVLNRAIPQVSGEIVILSDANTFFEPAAIRNLVRHFDDPNVGGVSGELKLTPRSHEMATEGFYWKFENILKFMENRVGATLGANGAIYALRKSVFEPIPPGTIIDDFVIFMKIREKGFRILFDPEAVAHEETAPNVGGEYRRRVRIGAGNFQSIALTWGLLNPLRGVVAMTFWSHKVLRWCVPFLMLTAFTSNLILLDQGTFYLYCMYIQIFVYLLAALGINRNFNSIIFKVPHYFVSMNLAILVGFFRYLRGSQRAAWERTPR